MSVQDQLFGGAAAPAAPAAPGAPAVPAARTAPGAPSVPAASVGEHVLRRGVAVAGLLGIALIHLLDLPGKLEETPYLGVGYLLLIVASLVVAEALVRTDHRLVWAAAGAVAAATLIGYVVNRTVGMPGATDDIGNWLEPLGLASMFVEGLVVAVAGLALLRRPAAARA